MVVCEEHGEYGGGRYEGGGGSFNWDLGINMILLIIIFYLK